MKLRLKVMDKSDVQKLTYSNIPVCTPGTEGLANVMTKEIFSRSDINSRLYESIADYTYCSYIDLEITWVPNYYASGTALYLLTKVFSDSYFKSIYDSDMFADKLSIKSIMDGKFIYNTKTDELIETSEFDSSTMSSVQFKVCGEVIRILIDKLIGNHENEKNDKAYCEFLVENEIKRQLSEDMSGILKHTLTKCGYPNKRSYFKVETINITKNETKFHIIDGYYINPNYNLEESQLYQNEEFQQEFQNVLNNEYISRIDLLRISQLLAMRSENSRKNFRNLVQDFVTVIPIGYRPTIEKRPHHFVAAYSNIISALSSYKAAYSSLSTNMSYRINEYKKLNEAVQNVMTTAETSFRQKIGKSYKPLAEVLKGKKGHIRGKMQSSIIDYAGRGVIVCDPDMPINTIGIPYKMLREVMEHDFIMSIKDNTTKDGKPISIQDKIERLNKSFLSDGSFEKLNRDTNKLSEGVKKQIDEFSKNCYVALGRQPTLYRHGIQGFKVRPVEGSSIIIPLLVTPPFNADFDGDQMWFMFPVSYAAKEEVREKMYVINNVFYSKDGSCTIVPRHEIIYGLYRASQAKPDGEFIRTYSNKSAETLEGIINLVKSGRYRINDILIIDGIKMSLGKAAIHACFTRDYFDVLLGSKNFSVRGNKQDEYDKEALCNAKWCQELLTHIYRHNLKSHDIFMRVCDNFVKVGIAVAKQYPPNVSCMKIPDISEIHKKFNEEVWDIQNSYMFGFETEESYSDKYDKIYQKYLNMVEKHIYNPDSENYIKPNNGFKLLADSGARGNESTIMQLFGIKGKMQKNSMETFNCVIFNNTVTGFTGLEHNMTAFGGRQGQIDKSVETSKPGYLSRRVSHASANYKITVDDCGTSNGVLINYRTLLMHLETYGDDMDISVWQEAKDLFKEIVVGKTVILPGSGSHRVTMKNAEDIFENYIAYIDYGLVKVIEDGIKMRSPITCDNPCCAVCYGIDPATGYLPVSSKHKNIGIEAAVTIGEPGTQMTMKNFQKGGIASDANLTSAFDLINSYLSMTDLNTSRQKTGVMVSDVLAPVEGYIKCQQVNTNVKKVFITDKDNPNKIIFPKGQKDITMYNGVKLKDYVKVGDSIQAELGNLSVYDVINVLGMEFGISYLLLKLYMIYREEVKVKICHFETIVASMQMYVCKRTIKTDKFEYVAGNSYSDIELKQYGGIDQKDDFVKQLVGIEAAAERNHNAFRGFMFENQSAAVSSHIVRSPDDYLDDYYVKMSFGLIGGNKNDL